MHNLISGAVLTTLPYARKFLYQQYFIINTVDSLLFVVYQFFVDLVRTRKPGILMFNKLKICCMVICTILENHEIKYQQKCKFSSIHKN